MKRIWLIVSMLSVCHMHAQEDWKPVIYAARNVYGKVDLNDLETYTMMSFKEHIQENYEKSIPYCIVRVESKEQRSNGTTIQYIQYYDAQYFNEAIHLNRVLQRIGLGGAPTLGDIVGYFSNPRDPRTSLKFEQKDVSYFFINKLTDKQFTFLSSLDEMMKLGSGVLPNLLIADLLLTDTENFLLTNDKAAARRIGHLLMGQMYCSGYPVPKNYERAVMHLRRFLDPKLSTGMLSKAQRIYTEVMGDSAPFRIRKGMAEAKLALGEIYSKGDAQVPRDLDKALYYVTAVTHDEQFPDLAASAQLATGELYTQNGQHDKAREYLTMAVNNKRSPDVAARAQKRLTALNDQESRK